MIFKNQRFAARSRVLSFSQARSSKVPASCFVEQMSVSVLAREPAHCA